MEKSGSPKDRKSVSLKDIKIERLQIEKDAKNYSIYLEFIHD